MFTFEELGLTYIDIIIMIAIGILSFLLTNWMYPKYIEFAKKKGWTGNDIHKHDRPVVAESGGIPFIIGIVPALIVVMIIYPQLRNETIVFLFMVVFSGIIGYIDDRSVLSTIKKLVLMIAIGIPIFFLNFFGYIQIDNPVIPILGQLRLTIIYPIIVPFIFVIMANLVNMLEGYNGEGSGCSLITIIFLIIASIISGSSEGLIFSLAIIGSLAAFFKFNKFKAKVFPGDVGTLALGASIACISVLGSLEVAMFCCILVQLFNGFYVVASLGGLKERHTITTKDIIMTEEDEIQASQDFKDHLTLPRLILATKPLHEDQLVKNFWALSVIGGLFGLVAEFVKIYTLGRIDIFTVLLITASIACIAAPIILKFKAIRGIVFFMFALLGLGLIFLILVDMFVVGFILNWLIAAIVAGMGFYAWYFLTIKYFWYKISKLSGEKYSISLIPFTKSIIEGIILKLKSKVHPPENLVDKEEKIEN